MKLATGTNRNKVLAAKYKAVASAKPVMAISVHRVVQLACHCHVPCAAVAALAVMATPAKVLPSTSLKRLENKAETNAPAGLVVSSATAVNVAEPDAATVNLTHNLVNRCRGSRFGRGNGFENQFCHGVKLLRR